MTLRRILPRARIRTLDNTEGTYPRERRTGDFRSGRVTSQYNDLDTSVFAATGTVSYPTSLSVGSTDLLTDLTSSIVVRGRVNKGVTNSWRTVTQRVESYAPYKEVGLHEQDINKLSATYTTGSLISDVGIGFKSPLGTKTKIRFELPLSFATQLDSHTASVYYYNAAAGFFEEIAPAEKTDPNPCNEPSFSTWPDLASPLDVKFFDALGNYNTTGSIFNKKLDALITGTTSQNYQFFKNAYADKGAEVLSFRDTQSILANSKYAATSTQSLSTTQLINSPFLLEKVTVELPFQAGTGWFNDRTRSSATRGGSGAGSLLGFGGPCVTFSLCNQMSPTHRELILSATIVPEGDTRPEIMHSDLPLSTNMWLFRGVKGITGYNVKPTVIVPSGSTSIFTGTLRFTTEARVSHGIVYATVQKYNTGDYAAYTPATAPVGIFGNDVSGYVETINSFGRGKDGRVSGRSIFGRDNISPRKNSYISYFEMVNAKLDVTSSTVSGSLNDLFVKNMQGNAVSPYLILPGDRLVIGISKYHAAPVETPTGTSASYFPLTSSHDVTIPAGMMRITMYGSLVKESAEFHDTLNQNLTSDAIHLAVCNDPVLDQWQIESRDSYSGSYTDNIITGSSPSFINSNVIGRGVIGSISAQTSSLGEDPILSIRYKRAYELGTNNMFVQLRSPNERYWDSLVPGIDDIVKNDNGKPWLGWNTAAPGVVSIALDRNGPLLADGDFEFSKNYPFAPRYLGLIRKSKLTKKLQASYYINGSSIDPTVTADRLVGDNTVFYVNMLSNTTHTTRVTGYISEWNITQLLINAPQFNAARDENVIKYFYGIGNLNTFTQEFIATSGYPTVPLGNTQSPEILFNALGTFGTTVIAWQGFVGVVIRGWKYGIQNAFETHSRVHFRRDKYGQFRDMLEQRLYGTFFETMGVKGDGTLGGPTGKLAAPISIKFIGSDGKTTIPSNTMSSNLSYEATSSLPYFDGESHNRPPIDLTTIGLSLG